MLKLFALPSLYRQGSIERVGIYENDIATLIHAFNPDMQSLMGELNEHLNQTDMTEARNILIDVEGRIQRFRKTSK